MNTERHRLKKNGFLDWSLLPDDFYIDIMARLGEVAVYEDLEYEIIDYQDIKIRIATPETLYKLKKDTIRCKDKFDAAYLEDLIKIRQSKVFEKKNPYKG